MKVNEIFLSIEGEGKRAGLPCIFIRLFGCNLKCSYCDTRYSCEGDEYTEYSIAQIMDSVRMYKCKNVTITGGEPLIHSGIEKLIDALMLEGYWVNVETNGSCEPKRPRIEAFRTTVYTGSLFYTMDWKCKCSGMSDQMYMPGFNDLRSDDVLKFVVGSIEDMDEALSVMERIQSTPQIYFSPVFGKIEASDIVAYLLSKQLFTCKVQLQMHKYIWEPTQRGV